MKVNIIVKADAPKDFEEIEIKLPIYALCGYNHETEREYKKGHKEKSISYEVKKISSPTETFSIRKRIREKSDGELSVDFEFEHQIDTTANVHRGHYLLDDDNYNHATTKDVWEAAIAELKQHLSKC